MIEPISLAVGAGLFIAGLVTGRLRRRPVSKKPEAMCGCTHGLEQHDPNTRQCHGQIERPHSSTEEGVYIGTQWVPCTCRQYVGPVPIEQLYATPLLPPQDPA